MLYLDSSAWVKNYWAEKGSAAVQELLQTGEVRASSILALFEVEASLGRLHREGKLGREELKKQPSAFLQDWDLVWVVALDAEVLKPVQRMVLTLPLRAGDAIHLASALLLAATGNPIMFCCAEVSLLRSAAKEGLSTWNPLTA